MNITQKIGQNQNTLHASFLFIYKVSDAMSMLRLRFGEPVRFKFLVGMLNSYNSSTFQVSMNYINEKILIYTKISFFFKVKSFFSNLNIIVFNYTSLQFSLKHNFENNFNYFSGFMFTIYQSFYRNFSRCQREDNDTDWIRRSRLWPLHTKEPIFLFNQSITRYVLFLMLNWVLTPYF